MIPEDNTRKETVNASNCLLAFESSCDDSSAALLDIQSGQVLWEKTLNRAILHAKFGGVVPEIAGRSHLYSFHEILGDLFSGSLPDLKNIRAMCVTTSPGLIGSLLVGVNVAKTLAWLYKKPLLKVDHIEGHIFSAFIGQDAPKLPFLALVVSGGHTLLVHVKDFGDYEVLGRTIDDAMGEAFDKAAKMLGLMYPGGPSIEKLAAMCEDRPHELPLPLKGKKTRDFSFSGLKTAVLYKAMDLGLYLPERPLNDPEGLLASLDDKKREDTIRLAAGFQESVCRLIDIRLRQAIRDTGVKTCCLCGGVAANKKIRSITEVISEDTGAEFRFPLMKYCSDNAAMIGYAAKLDIDRNGTPEGVDLTIEPTAGGRFS